MADTLVQSPVDHRAPLGASLVALGAGMVWSLGALTTRLAEQSDAWQYLAWRSVAILVVVEVLYLIRRRPSPLWAAFTTGPVMLGACLSFLAASVAGIYALKTTTAANASFLASITPLVAAVLARLFLGERLSRVTIWAGAVAMVGLLIMVISDLGEGRMSGNIAAVLSSVGYASYTVLIRSDPARDWSPVLPGYAVLMIGIGTVVTLASGRPLIPPPIEIGYAAIHGAVFVSLGTVMFNAASRTVPAAAMTLLAQSETVFVPVWVFLAFGERPGPATLLGASIIMTAVVMKVLLDTRPPRAIPVPAP